jgi:hypothetical protein
MIAQLLPPEDTTTFAPREERASSPCASARCVDIVAHASMASAAIKSGRTVIDTLT